MTADLDRRIGRIRDAADRLNTIAGDVESIGGHDTALRLVARLLTAVAVTHDHYGDCRCAEATAAVALADAILTERPL